MTKKLTNVPIDALTEIMGKLDLKDATALGSVSTQTRAALDRAHPTRYKGPPDYTKGKGKYQKEYDGLEKTMDSLFVKVGFGLTLKQSRKLHKNYYQRLAAFEKAQEAYLNGRLVYTMTRYWKTGANLKEVYKGVVKQLKTMGKVYDSAIKALQKKPKEADETQMHKIMDALVKYLPQFTVK